MSRVSKSNQVKISGNSTMNEQQQYCTEEAENGGLAVKRRARESRVPPFAALSAEPLQSRCEGGAVRLSV